ncbi:hypothetical protein [Streptomyces sp. B4I13]|uniref:hypothetical protein n=1 Tax=Streptomyces sp. B4I13 TaxID=3042271 RepID=UPI0027D875EB|nr:hypothetical protein [Streptomyces sp. B4I13]
MSNNDARVRRPAVFEYRCKLCGATETAATQAEARAVRAAHRDEFHGPDEIVEVGRMRFVDLPREQKLATVVVALGVVFKCHAHIRSDARVTAA